MSDFALLLIIFNTIAGVTPLYNPSAGTKKKPALADGLFSINQIIYGYPV